MGDPRLPWGTRTGVMGVLNLTPDSFSDGGRFDRPEAAVRQARLLLAQGADLLDLGAQSTRPGAEEVGPQRELERLLPALTAIRAAHPEALLSIDTFHAAVAEAALAAGAHWINDVSGGRRDPALLRLVAAAGCPLVLMHSRGDSRSMDSLARYGDVVAEVRQGLLQASDTALAAGVRPEQLIWDPGLGFAKDTEQNLALLRGLAVLAAEGVPLLVGPSRKRFIGAVLEEPRPRARLWGTAAVCSQAIAQGARLLRVHDVAPIVQIARMADALRADGPV
ncbi:dihydropteroate synthase [Cyanobium sp. FACHB-13342]|uniref:dihydropteroate synthase n=1 Tax=Cyanobium sp. FACHB-13342 TaxID=2692793 RepID=UPI001F554378|nr:dihydropteroate synthase [Cyanobium sp. FACHB-13342]